MKNNILFTAIAIAVMLLGSCSKTSVETGTVTEKATLSASIEDVDTKTTLDGVEVRWSENDKLALYSDSDLTKKEYTLTSGIGEKKATFTGDLIGGTKFIAIYPSKSAVFESNIPAIRINTPHNQTYVENGIADDLLPMVATGTSLDKMNFTYVGGILRIKLFAQTSKKIKSILFSPNNINNISGTVRYSYCFTADKNWATLGNYGAAPSENNITLNCGSVALSTDKNNPTVFNIVYGGSFSCEDFTVTVESVSGEKMLLSKKGISTFEKGRIKTFNATEFRDNVASENKVIALDGDQEGEPLYSCKSTPSTSVKVLTKNEVLTSADIDHIISIVEKADNAIELDLSESQYTSTTLCTIVSKKIRSIKLPSNVTKLQKNAFKGCTALEEIDLTKITTIETYAFDYCAFTTINIPASVTNISDDWISYSGSKVTAYKVDENNPNYKSVDGVLFTKDGSILKEYPRAKVSDTYIVPEGTVKIQRYAFLNSGLKHITLPKTITTTEYRSFPAGIQYIKCLGNTPAPNFNADDLPNGGTLEVPKGYKENYKKAWSWIETKGWNIIDGTSPSSSSAKIGDLRTNVVNQGGFWN